MNAPGSNSFLSRVWKLYRRHEELLWVVGTACAMGIALVCLACKGNPSNAGICVSCFLENLAGSLGFHDNDRMRYMRPELVGIVLGGTAAAMLFGEFKVTGGSSPIVRFIGGFFMIVGSAVFMGCPIRMINRLANGDWSAWVGVPGLVLGVWLGWWMLGKGVHLGTPHGSEKGQWLSVPGGNAPLGGGGLLGLGHPDDKRLGGRRPVCQMEIHALWRALDRVRGPALALLPHGGDRANDHD
jgi:hypothetical protein